MALLGNCNAAYDIRLFSKKNDGLAILFPVAF